MLSIREILKKSYLSKEDKTFLFEVEKIIGFPPRNIKLYREAFTHPLCVDSSSVSMSYERLEFLGDAILGAVISHYLFLNAPQKDEGYLTKMRSKMVQRDVLNRLGKELDLVSLLRFKVPRTQLGNNIYGNLFEALVGAIYLDKGYAESTKFIERKLIRFLDGIKNIENKVISYKSLIIEWSQKNKKNLLIEVEEEPSDTKAEKYFVSKLFVDGVLEAKARETSKKRAEEKASKRAFYKIEGRK